MAHRLITMAWALVRSVALPAALVMFLGGCVAGMATGAAATAGIAAQQERGFAASVDDAQTLAAVNAGLLEKSGTLFARLGVQVHEGRVLLSGPVDTPGAEAAAIEVARNTPRVREVIDEIVAGGSYGDYVQDSWISQQLRSKLMFDADIRAINYSVHTVNGTIHLLGVAQDEAELARVLHHAGDIAYVRRVANHVMLKDDPRRALP
jgi:osmotically-inducible protein OsmY